jgi:ABC-type siderophore export system fused ATPase/permease subunit
LKIETLFSEINKAMAWNRREEDALANEVRTRIEGNNQLVLNEFIKKRKYYTEKLQIQLSKCSQIGTKIETNIQVATFVRSIGLYTFFTVLLIGTMMLDPKFTFVLSFILIYAMVGSAFMQEGSNVRTVWQQFTKQKE